MPRNSQRHPLRPGPGRLHSRLRNRIRRLVHHSDRRLRGPNPRNALAPPRKLQIRKIQRSLAPTPQPVMPTASHPLITLSSRAKNRCHPPNKCHPERRIIVCSQTMIRSRGTLLSAYVDPPPSRHPHKTQVTPIPTPAKPQPSPICHPERSRGTPGSPMPITPHQGIRTKTSATSMPTPAKTQRRGRKKTALGESPGLDKSRVKSRGDSASQGRHEPRSPTGHPRILGRTVTKVSPAPSWTAFLMTSRLQAV
jgi:hypothetical protein